MSLEMDIEQDGLILEAIGFQKSLDEKDSMKYRLKGAIDGQEVRLESTDIIYKTGLSCLSVLELTYKKDKKTESLTGKWKD